MYLGKQKCFIKWSYNIETYTKILLPTIMARSWVKHISQEGILFHDLSVDNFTSNKQYNCSRPPAFKSQREGYQSGQN